MVEERDVFIRNDGYYIEMTGANWNVRIYAPVDTVKDLDTLMNTSLLLALFSSDEEVKKKIKKTILASMNLLD